MNPPDPKTKTPIYPTPCLICGKPVEDYIAEYCCGGQDCGCLGLPIEPCLCSKECSAALFDNDGTMEERRTKAGIATAPTYAALELENQSLTRRLEEVTAINKKACADWADDDTAIKKLAAPFGIREDDTPGYFKNSVQVVEEMAAKLTEAEKERDQLRSGIESRDEIISDFDGALKETEEARERFLKEAGDALAKLTEAEKERDAMKGRFAAINGQINIMANAVNGQRWDLYWTASDAAQKVISGDYDHAIGANFEAFRRTEQQRDEALAKLTALRTAAEGARDALADMIRGAQKQNWQDNYPQEINAAYKALAALRAELDQPASNTSNSPTDSRESQG